MEAHKKVSRAAGTVGGMTLLSRIFGFIRDTVIAMMFGASASADAFFVAFRIPNLQRRILGEGAVTSAFIPVFSECLKTQGEEEAWSFTGRLFNIFLLALILITLGIMIFAPEITAVFAPGFVTQPGKFELTVSLTRWMAPFLIFVGLAAFCMGILNCLKIFALPAAAPTVLNVCMILSALLISPRLEQPIYGIAIGVLVGGFFQLLIQLPATFRAGFRFVPVFDWKHPSIIKISKLITPAILGLAVYEVNILVDTLIASLLPGGSISYLYYANRLVQFPLGIFGVALGVAILPTLSDYAAQKNMAELVKTLAFGIRLILFITVPATVGIIILRFPIVNTLWERGAFSRETTEGTSIALLYYALGLCAFAGTKVIVSAFYSLQDTKTPAKIGIYSMLLNIVLCAILMWPLKHGGLALATSISALFNVVTLMVILKKRLGLIGGMNILRAAGKLAVAALAMAGSIFFFNQMFFQPTAPAYYKLFILITCITLGMIVFIFVSKAVKNEELEFLKELIQERSAGKIKTD
jgi:putative peptidoglycan lipid II flippase